MGFKVFKVDTLLETVRFEIKKTKDSQSHFALQGVSLENDDPGLVYHSIGVNGAKVASFLRCQKFTPHLSALHPDLVIISLGTNDAYFYNFNEGEYKKNLNELIDMIRQASPETSILLTAPGDGMRSKWQLNQNYEKAKNILVNVAHTRNCGFWDFYDVMGGIKSIQTWAAYGLSKTDYLHLTADGYKLQGELLFRALILEEYFAEHQQITGN